METLVWFLDPFMALSAIYMQPILTGKVPVSNPNQYRLICSLTPWFEKKGTLGMRMIIPIVIRAFNPYGDMMIVTPNLTLPVTLGRA
jgi:hypothetical protein